MTDLSCRELVELVTDYLEDALDPETRRRFREHLDECAGCATYVDQMREASRRLGAVPPLESVPDEARRELLNAFRDFAHRRDAD